MVALGSLVAVYKAAVGVPTTPMTLAHADRLFGDALPPGIGAKDADAWLASQGIFPSVLPGPNSERLRREDWIRHAPDGRWMDSIGGQTVAECAGLKTDDVSWYTRVTYPDADRFLLGQTKITVYLFFDTHDHLIKHWVSEFHLMP